ncbi:hypothetical protein ABTN72_19710, partial [Acinetobacter baumannii]
LQRLDAGERARRIGRSAMALTAAGAQYVIDDVSALMPVVHEVAAKVHPCARRTALRHRRR